MLEQWWSDYCPKCKSKNFICNGDPNDMTAMDVEGMRCWNCDHCWKIGDGTEDMDEDAQDPYFQRGVHFEEVKHEKNTH